MNMKQWKSAQARIHHLQQMQRECEAAARNGANSGPHRRKMRERAERLGQEAAALIARAWGYQLPLFPDLPTNGRHVSLIPSRAMR